ncbi:MAG: hypothetical protein NVS2B16_17570 [Chloroflexota bacterium]
MTSERLTAGTTDTFSSTEMQSLHNLRNRYQQDLDLFTDRERAYLGFVRWQYETGLITSQGA